MPSLGNPPRGGTVKRAILAGTACAVLALSGLHALAAGNTVYRSDDLRITEFLGGGRTTWTFRNRTNHAERVSCRVGISVILSDGSAQDHIHLATSIDPKGHSTRYLEYGDGVVSIRSTSWRCRVN
jgi:hypothetical protein